MSNLLNDLSLLISEAKSRNLNFSYTRLLLKERLQYYVLNYLYNEQKYLDLFFIGGSSLRFCYELPRLSEDLDFDTQNKINKQTLGEDLKKYFANKCGYENIECAITGVFERITLKFPLCYEIGLSDNRTEKLFLKIEINQKKTIDNYKTIIKPISKDQFSFTLRTFDLSVLFGGKISAVINRVFIKGKNNEITFKGRDYYDLWWYLSKKIVPDIDFIKEEVGLSTIKSVVEKIDERVNAIKPEYLEMDLIPLFENAQFVKDFSKNFREIYLRESQYLRGL